MNSEEIKIMISETHHNQIIKIVHKNEANNYIARIVIKPIGPVETGSDLE